MLSIKKIYYLVPQEERNMTITHVVDDSILSANAYFSKKAYGIGRGFFVRMIQGIAHIAIDMTIPSNFATKSIITHR